jgi:hypothetical protein
VGVKEYSLRVLENKMQRIYIRTKEEEVKK